MRAAAPPRYSLRYPLAGIVLLGALALVFSNRLPYWQGMTVLMGLVAVATALLLRRAGEPIFQPSWADTALGLALALASFAAARLVLAWTAPVYPPLGSGLALVAGYAAHEPLAWAYAGVLVIAPAEELFWRHYLPFLLAGWRGDRRWHAQLICVIPYAGLHLFSGTFWLFVPAVAFGTAWGLLTAWRGSPWAAIVWHLVFDALIFLWFPPARV